MGTRRILIGCCGGLTGSYLARQFKGKGLFVIGADGTAMNVTKHFVDDFVVLPKINDECFINNLIKLLKEKEITDYIPTHSKEIRKISQNEKKIRSNWKGNFIVSPYETIKTLDEKALANHTFHEIGIPVPRIYENDLKEEDFPVFMKPNIGSGSKDSRIVETIGLYNEYKKIYPDNDYYEYIDGVEYTVDCIFDNEGRLLAYNQRKRNKSLGGAVIITQNDYSFNILPFLKKIEARFTIKGCVNFQFILKDNTPYFTDINLRYPSGGLPLSVESGIDIPQILLDLFDNKPIPSIECNRFPGRVMYRYFEEIFDE